MLTEGYEITPLAMADAGARRRRTQGQVESIEQQLQGVLRRSGFTQYGLAERFLFIAGGWQDHVLFQRILHDDPLGDQPA